MIRTITTFVTAAFLLVLGTFETSAQLEAEVRPIYGDDQATERIDDYLNLLHQGYSEIEIFQDLGNANLLTQNYESAAFWYERLLKYSMSDLQRERFQRRFAYAQSKSLGELQNDTTDWSKAIMDDYDAPNPSEYFINTSTVMVSGDGSFKKAKQQSVETLGDDYAPKLAMTADGKVAFFSRAVTLKPEVGIFSKKEIVYEIYRAENLNGKWKNITKMDVCPKYFSAKHPSVSHDGTRLYFASNMPGSYGKYDIYVSEIKMDGSLGEAKNLGEKVNTKKDDLFPSVVNNSTLVYASNGRKGQGGLDLYSVTVNGNRLGNSQNLGNRVNSRYDDFALTFSPSKRMGFVLSNRGNQKTVAQYAFGPKETDPSKLEKDDQKLWDALHNDNQTKYSSTIFDD